MMKFFNDLKVSRRERARPRPAAAAALLVPLIGCGGENPAGSGTGSASAGSSGAPTLSATAVVDDGSTSPAPPDASDGTTAPGSGGADDDSSTGEAPATLWGFADLHNHPFAEAAHGGGWVHGSHAGPMEQALASCDGGVPGDHARVRSDLGVLFDECEESGLDLGLLADTIPILNLVLFVGGTPLSEFIGSIEGSGGDTGVHLGRTDGAPAFDGWPRWDVIAHQQTWEGFIEQSWRDGLRLTVFSAVSSDWLCRALPPGNLDRPQCDEMDDVEVQLQMAHAFVDRHAWAELALTAADARRIAAEGRLAIVLSVEISHLFGDEPWEPQLDALYAQGVRTLQLVHQLDNRFAGAAPHNAIFHVAQFTDTCHVDNDCGLTTADVTLGFDVDAQCRNVRGLTDEGRAVAQQMMDRGMLIDAAHMSEASVIDLHELAAANDYYPFYVSHGHMRDILMPPQQRQEKTTPTWVVEMIRQTGGMFGLRTGAEPMYSYPSSGVDNDCHGSVRSFAQHYAYAAAGLKVPVGLATDFNGFIQQLRPRFGPHSACGAGFEAEAACQVHAQADPTGTPFDEIGLAHQGMLGPMLADLEAVGGDPDALMGSAEAFVQMWERAESPREPTPLATDDMDLGGIEPLPEVEARQEQFPSVCGTMFCPGILERGETCDFDDQCVSGRCNSGPCGVPNGTCQ